MAGSASAGAIGQQLLSDMGADAASPSELGNVGAIGDGRSRTIAASEPAQATKARSEQGELPVTPPEPGRAAASTKRTPTTVPGEDPSAVFEAIRALRKGDDPARAQKLLKRYLADHPQGVLSEDAVALSIEAAEARGDSEARTLAQRYLARYPKGRHAGLAHSVLARD